MTRGYDLGSAPLGARMLATLVADEIRLLTFRRPSAAVQTHREVFLAFGLFFTWLAGVGRYWDNPRAELWQHLGLGSLLYVFILAFVLWALLAPLRPQNWSYRNVLLFVSLTAPPAVLYAIPVERFVSPAAALAMNAWFLAVVAVWRVALLVVFLTRVARLTAGVVLVATLLPLSLIVVGLSMLNLEHVAFSLMSGINPEEASPNDTAYGIVVLLSYLSIVASPFLLLGYLVCVFRAFRSDAEVSPEVSLSPGMTADGQVCLHTGETATYCTRCWMNLYEERQRRRSAGDP